MRDGGFHDCGVVDVWDEGDDDVCLGNGVVETCSVLGDVKSDGCCVFVVACQSLSTVQSATGDGDVNVCLGEGLDDGFADEAGTEEKGFLGGTRHGGVGTDEVGRNSMESFYFYLLREKRDTI